MQARRTAAAAALADFRREDDAFCAEDSYTLAVPDYGRHASRLATELASVLAPLAHEKPDPAAAQLAQVQFVLEVLDWHDAGPFQDAMEQIEEIVNGENQ
jgi:hypothetical protein